MKNVNVLNTIMTRLFEKKYSDYLTVYRIPVGPNQLDPVVFSCSDKGEEPKLLPAIHAQITQDLERLVSNQPERIKNYYLVGPATKPGSKNKTGDIRVVVELNKNIMDADIDGLLAEDLLKLAKSLSGKLATGTCRKIMYVLTVRPVAPSDYEGIYNIPHFNWLKLPQGATK
jgi:hypothetical protein